MTDLDLGELDFEQADWNTNTTAFEVTTRNRRHASHLAVDLIAAGHSFTATSNVMVRTTEWTFKMSKDALQTVRSCFPN